MPDIAQPLHYPPSLSISTEEASGLENESGRIIQRLRLGREALAFFCAVYLTQWHPWGIIS